MWLLNSLDLNPLDYHDVRAHITTYKRQPKPKQSSNLKNVAVNLGQSASCLRWSWSTRLRRIFESDWRLLQLVEDSILLTFSVTVVVWCCEYEVSEFWHRLYNVILHCVYRYIFEMPKNGAVFMSCRHQQCRIRPIPKRESSDFSVFPEDAKTPTLRSGISHSTVPPGERKSI